jgi:pyruvate kinase
MNIKKVKIVATLGPASDTEEVILQLAQEGVNVFRINFSHATKDQVVRWVPIIRKVEKEVGHPLAIMGDLAGPKIRIGEIEEGTVLEKDKIVTIVKEKITGTSERFSLNFPDIVPQLKEGAEVFIDDGKLKLEVTEESKTEAKAKVIVGGKLLARKGFNAQGISLELDGLSERDQLAMQLVIEHQMDALAVSFVQTPGDIISVRELLPVHSEIAIVCKMETAMGLKNIEQILDVVDVLMIARGDLGLAVPLEEVPHLQKNLIQMCLERAKPVITATQMLESMITNPIPTRAEVSDVANAIMDGTDAVMLSAETSTGSFPVETVKTMHRIIRRAVRHVPIMDHEHEHTIADAISGSVGRVADRLGAKLIIAFTESGSTARLIARNRHQQPILALSPDDQTVRQLCFSYNVYSKKITPTQDFNEMMQQAREIAVKNEIVPLEEGDPFVIVSGMPFGKRGTTNMIYAERV